MNVFRLILLSFCCTVVAAMQSCSRNSDEFTIKNSALSCTDISSLKAPFIRTIKSINEDALPKGVVPLQLQTKDELNDLLKEIENIQCNITTNKKPIIKSRSESGPGSFSSVHYYGDYDILVVFAWEEKGGELQVATTNASSWYFSAWEQTTAVAAWDGMHRIRYDITGIIKIYVLVELELFEISRIPVTMNGYVNI